MTDKEYQFKVFKPLESVIWAIPNIIWIIVIIFIIIVFIFINFNWKECEKEYDRKDKAKAD